MIAQDSLIPCGCGRSATGFCTGLHELSDQEWDKKLLEDLGLESQVPDQSSTDHATSDS